MTPFVAALGFLPWIDWVALAGLFVGWAGYSQFARRLSASRPSLLASGNRVRHDWMLQTTLRENRVLDGVVVQNLSSSSSFFASTTLLIIGGLLAVLRASEQTSEWVRELPFAARTTALVFDLKVGVLTAIFVYSFFRFTWSLRQYSFGALLVAAAPDEYVDDTARHAFAQRAGRVLSLAAETFNDGLRGYYMSFAVVAWFFSAWAFLAVIVAVIVILYRREFRSEVLEALTEVNALPTKPR